MDTTPIPLPDSKLFDHYRRVLYVSAQGEKQALCAHCLRDITGTRMPNPKAWKPVAHGWGECENVFCGWRNIKRDKEAGTVESSWWVAGYKEHHALTFPAWYEQVNIEVQAESDHPAHSWATWDNLHRAWLNGDSPADTADDLLYKHGFRSNWDNDTENDEDHILAG